MAPRLLRRVGALVSADARYCQTARAAGADYLLAVKANQPDLLDDVALLFRDPPPGEHFQVAQTVTKHGGRLEVRWLRASAALAAYLREADSPDVGLVLAVETQVSWPVRPARPPRHDGCYFLSSLPANTAPTALLRFVRAHWQIENRLRWPRDMTQGKMPVRCGSGVRPRRWPRCAMPCWARSTATLPPTAPAPFAPAPGRLRITSSPCLVCPPPKL